MTVEFGPVIDYARVENAIRDQVVLRWIDTYLTVVERENNVDPRTIRRPRSWRVIEDITVTPEKNLPLVYVVSAGESDDPQDDGTNELSSVIPIGILAAVKDTDRDATRVLTRRYAAAIAALVGHKLGGAGLGIRLASQPRQTFDERAAQPRSQTLYILGLAYVTFDVQVDLIRYRHGGPDEPFPNAPDNPPPPNPLDPDHETTHVHVDVAGMNEEVS